MRTVLAVEGYPVVTQIPLHSDPQYFAAVSVLQEVLPLLTAAGVVVPQGLHPLWDTHTHTATQSTSSDTHQDTSAFIQSFNPGIGL